MDILLDTDKATSSPHITKANHHTRRIMRDVLIALIPVMLVSIFFFGHLVIVNIVVCVLACIFAEVAYGLIFNKQKVTKANIAKSSAWDLSCCVTGVILALNLPTIIDVWGWHWRSGDTVYLSLDTILICLVGSIFCIAVVKMLFGGIGRNFVSPSATGRVFLFLAVGLAAVRPSVNMDYILGADGGLSLTSGASWLSTTGDGVYNSMLNGRAFWDMFVGNVPSAAVGETSVFAILIGYLYLVWRKVIDWRMPIILILAVAFFAIFFGLGDSRIEYDNFGTIFGYVLAHILSGGLIFGAVFMATDYTTNPNTFWGSVIFMIGVALFTMLIRVFASYPEGMSFALILMELTTPLIDRFLYPRHFGFVKTAAK